VHSALATSQEGTASLNSNLELEEDVLFTDCDLKAERTRLSLTLSGSNFVCIQIINAKINNKLLFLTHRYKPGTGMPAELDASVRRLEKKM